MKETGIVRKVDKVGRIVLPREVRWKYKIECGDMVEIYTDQDCICFKKYETDANVMEQVEVLYETVDKMEKEVKETKELEEYLKRVRSKLDQLQKLKGV